MSKLLSINKSAILLCVSKKECFLCRQRTPTPPFVVHCVVQTKLVFFKCLCPGDRSREDLNRLAFTLKFITEAPLNGPQSSRGHTFTITVNSCL